MQALVTLLFGIVIFCVTGSGLSFAGSFASVETRGWRDPRRGLN